MKTNSCERWYGTRHTWNKWETIDKGDVSSTVTRAKIGEWILQERVCSVCGLKERNKQET